MDKPQNRPTAKSSKATTLLVAIVFTCAVSGFFMGLRQTVREAGPVAPPATGLDAGSASHGHAIPAPDYSDIAAAGYGPNRNWKSRLSDLAPSSDPRSLSPRDSARLRQTRLARRAYDGSPPVVPHPIDQHTATSCLQCHQTATQIGDVVAPAISHPAYSSCTQCHVSAEGLGSMWNTSDFDLHTGNRFGGYHQPLKGERAYPDSPPTVPHTLHMRQNCMSCHGPLGTSPILTSHPERQSCTQCHVPSDDVEAANFSESAFPYIQSLAEGDPSL